MTSATEPRTACRSRALSAVAVALAVVGTIVLGLPTFSEAATIRPNTTFDETVAGGTCSLREAVSSANANSDQGGCTHSGTYGVDTILLGGGDYKLTLKGFEDNNASGDLDITHSLTITGVGPNETSINGNGAITSDRVLDVFNPGTVLNLSDLTIRGGQPPSGYDGGGVQASDPIPLNLTHVVVRDNAARDGGGISDFVGASVTLTNSSIRNNSAATFGGGMVVGSATLINSTVSNNSVNGDGGGIRGGDDVTLTRSTVSGNTAAGAGGGVYVQNGRAILDHSAVTDNKAAAFAGGIFASFGVALTDTAVTGNRAGDTGGGIQSEGSVVRSTVSGNVSGNEGAGITTFDGNMTIAKSTIAGNDATGTNTQGGGIYFASSGTLDVVDSTLSGNEATGWGGGLSSETSVPSTINLKSDTINRNIADADSDGMGDGGGFDQAPDVTVHVLNTIVAGNLDLSGEQPDCNTNTGGTHSYGYNVFGTATGCPAPVAGQDQVLGGADPGLAQLAHNGGPTLTSSLLSASPAVNHGPPGTGCPSIDQRGVPRSLGGRCDVGAYERVSCQGHLVNVVGTGAADTLSGTPGADGILGLGGNDTLSGGAGNDGLCGDAGNDHLNGGAGTDSCDGGTETDTATACETTKNVP